eukprot:11950334-Alexandrium_andersonii.AAC.1
MSASLVGSEMCIRDSSESARTTARSEPLQSAGERVSSRFGVAFPTARGVSCLLYTSDAADDM